MSIGVPDGFSMKAVIYSHGWSVLPPFAIDEDEQGLSVALRLPPAAPSIVTLRQTGKTLSVVADPAPTGTKRAFTAALRRVVRSMLRLDEDLRPVYLDMRKYPRFRWVEKLGAGRILRAATAFEDTVKIICTTNCSWSLTELMIRRLTESLGEEVNGRYTFPTPEVMASRPERFYRNTIRAGYRSPYLREFARRVARKELDLEGLRSERAPKEKLIEALSAIKGIGPYAMDNLLRFHGVYDTFAHDSWIRAQYFDTYHGGRRVQDRTIERRYAEFGPWRGLVYWLDMTRPWYEKNFDFR